MNRLQPLHSRVRAVQAQLPARLRLKLLNVISYWSLVAFHLYNTFWYRPAYPNKETFLSPGAYAFWVWPSIHVLLLGYTCVQFIPRAQSLVISSIGYRFSVISLISAAYLYFQYRRWYILSFFLSLSLLAVVSKVFYIVRTRQRIVPELSRFHWALKEICIHMPFSLYHSWSLVLMILSLVQAFGKDVHREHAGGWTRVFVWLALLFLTINSFGYAYASEVGDLAGTAVITYVLWAIFEHQTEIRSIHWSALVFAIFSSLAFLLTLHSSIRYLYPSKSRASERSAFPAPSSPFAPPAVPRRPRAGTRTRSAQMPPAAGAEAQQQRRRRRAATVAASGAAEAGPASAPVMPGGSLGSTSGGYGRPQGRRQASSSVGDERTPLLRRMSESAGPGLR